MRARRKVVESKHRLGRGDEDAEQICMICGHGRIWNLWWKIMNDTMMNAAI
jgi:hypothetical protein